MSVPSLNSVYVLCRFTFFLSSNELFVLCSHTCKWHALMSLHGILGPCTLFFCSCEFFCTWQGLRHPDLPWIDAFRFWPTVARNRMPSRWHWSAGKRKVRSDAACQCLAWTQFMFLPVYILLSSNELFVLRSHSCKWHALMSLHGILGPRTLFFCHTPSFTHHFVTYHLSHTTFTHTIFHTKLCHIHHFLCRAPSFTYHFVTHNSSHTTCFTVKFYFSILHHLLCLSFLPRPLYNICCSLLEEVGLRGYPVL